MASCLVVWLAFAQLLRLVRPQLLDTEGATDHPIIRGASHRSPVRRNALEVCPWVAIEPYALSDWSPLEMLNIPDVI